MTLLKRALRGRAQPSLGSANQSPCGTLQAILTKTLAVGLSLRLPIIGKSFPCIRRSAAGLCCREIDDATRC